jgi:hypothetical protein
MHVVRASPSILAVLLAGAACKPTRPGYPRPANQLTAAAPALGGSGTPRSRANAPTIVPVELTEWAVTLGMSALDPGATTFRVHNRGTIPHQFEVEGAGMEKRTRLIPPDSTVTLAVELKAGSYELYCPVGGGAHKKMGMLAHATVASK